MIRTYLNVDNIPNDRHPREGGGPLKTLKKMDSRLRGNDVDLQTCSGRNFEISLCFSVLFIRRERKPSNEYPSGFFCTEKLSGLFEAALAACVQ